MNHQTRLKELHAFLLPYAKIWQNEIMLQYPHPTQDYPTGWITEMKRFNAPSDHLKIERKEVEDLLTNESTLELFRTLKKLTTLPRKENIIDLPGDKFTYLHMIPKKKYEIQTLAPLIHQTATEHKEPKALVDLGGGVGLLAQTLAREYGHSVLSLDGDAFFQSQGEKRIKKYIFPEGAGVIFKNLFITDQEESFLNTLGAHTLSIGLHTCGGLAVTQIKGSAQKKASLINMGCCYLKLKPQETLLSQAAKESPLDMHLFALTLASRAHKRFTIEDIEYKKLVKQFRYTLHFLLYEEFGQKANLEIGNSPKSLYEKDFATYAKFHLEKQKLQLDWSTEKLNDYFARPENLNLIHEMLCAGLIRDAFGKALEVYLLTDRALYLEEQGYKAELFEVFDEMISPRSIALIASPLSLETAN